MQCWVVDRPAPVDAGPLRRVERAVPDPGPRARSACGCRCCGVCRTDLHLAEGDLRAAPTADRAGPRGRGRGRRAWARARSRFAPGRADRRPLARHAPTAPAAYCRSGRENLCVAPAFTGWDVDGGYADYCLVDEAFAYALPDGDQRRAGRAAAVRRHHRLPRAAAGRGAARRRARHLRLRRQRAPDRAAGAAPGPARARADPRRGQPPPRPSSSASTRSATADAAPPEPLDGAILFAPGRRAGAGRRCAPWRRGGTLAVAGIWLSDIPALNYADDAVPRSGSCAASPPTPAPTASSSCAWPRASASGPRPTPYPMARAPTARSPTWPTAGSAAPPSCTTTRLLR